MARANIEIGSPLGVIPAAMIVISTIAWRRHDDSRSGVTTPII